MTKNELSQAVAIAQNQNSSLLNENIGIFDGFALPSFQPVACTIQALAALVRWQCCCLDGSIDHEALQEIARYGKHRFMVIG